MGHIERRVWSGKASYRARYRDPSGRERSKSFSRKVDAERWLAEVEHTKTRGMWTRGSAVSASRIGSLPGGRRRQTCDRPRKLVTRPSCASTRSHGSATCRW